MKKYARIPRPKQTRERITQFQKADDIIIQLRRAEFNSRKTSKKLAPFFASKDPMITCKRIWLFLRNSILYDREPKTDQTAKEIGRIINDGYGDCKHYATSLVGIINACGVPAWFTFISQRRDSKSPNHAYCCALINGKVVAIDPCKSIFGSEARWSYKYHVPPIKSESYGFKLSSRRRNRRKEKKAAA